MFYKWFFCFAVEIMMILLLAMVNGHYCLRCRFFGGSKNLDEIENGSFHSLYLVFKLQGKDVVKIKGGVRSNFPTACRTFP